jgi:putative transposase
MTARLPEVAAKKKQEQSGEQQAAAGLVRQARERGLSLTGPDGLLRQLTKTVLETALNEEMTEHLGYEKHDSAGAGAGNIRNGTRAKTVLTDHRAATRPPPATKRRQPGFVAAEQQCASTLAPPRLGARE